MAAAICLGFTLVANAYATFWSRVKINERSDSDIVGRYLSITQSRFATVTIICILQRSEVAGTVQ